MTGARDFNLTFGWIPAGGEKQRKTIVKVAARDQLFAIELALRAIRLDKSIPADATIRSISL